MVRVERTEEFLAHAGKKGMKWGYNDGSRNGRRTATELNDVANAIAEYNKRNNDPNSQGSGDVEGDYHEANNMLKYLGITLDLQSDDEKVAETMAIYNQMKNTKDKYKSQHEWLKAFSSKLASAGYDMDAVDKALDANKDKLNVMKTGTGTGNREKSNQDWKENDAPKSTKKKSSSKKEENKTSTSSVNSTGTTKKKRRKSSFTMNNKSKVTHSENQNGNELYHHGILGQKWHVRRYQNLDGSLTSEGRKHYGYGDYSNMSDSELRNKISRKRLENRYKDLKVGRNQHISGNVDQANNTAQNLVKAKYGRKVDTNGLKGDELERAQRINDHNSNVRNASDAIGKVTKDTVKIVDRVNDVKYQNERDRLDVSHMSNDDLKRAVERMQLEQEMRQLDNMSVNKGYKITTDTLQNIGLVASTAVDVITLAVLVGKFMNKKVPKEVPR